MSATLRICSIVLLTLLLQGTPKYPGHSLDGVESEYDEEVGNSSENEWSNSMQGGELFDTY